MLTITNILACTVEGGYALRGGMPWGTQAWAKSDLGRFSAVTRRPNSAVLMGRKTWESLPHKPLQGRHNIVVSSRPEAGTSAVSWAKSFNEGVEAARLAGCTSVWVIGGDSMWVAAKSHPEYVGDDVLITPEEYETDQRTSIADTFDCGNRHEDAYLRLMGRIITEGVVNPNRTGVDTRVLLNKKLKFELSRDGRPIIPLLTSKTCLLKNICVELASFLRADDNTEFMRERGCNIWDGNSTREFLDSRGLHDYEPGQLGPIYGCQWRRWNADWSPTEGFTSGGFDQIADLIKRARATPDDRRLIVSAWNPTKVSQMALPPCHMFFQVNILSGQAEEVRVVSSKGNTPESPQDGAKLNSGDKHLHLTFYMRSADIALGVPYNIASYAILAHLLAREIGVKPGTVTCIMANCHIYENHVELAREQVKRPTYAFPTLDMKSNTIEEFINMPYADNIRVDNYVHGAFIPYPMN